MGQKERQDKPKKSYGGQFTDVGTEFTLGKSTGDQGNAKRKPHVHDNTDYRCNAPTFDQEQTTAKVIGSVPIGNQGQTTTKVVGSGKMAVQEQTTAQVRDPKTHGNTSTCKQSRSRGQPNEYDSVSYENENSTVAKQPRPNTEKSTVAKQPRPNTKAKWKPMEREDSNDRVSKEPRCHPLGAPLKNPLDWSLRDVRAVGQWEGHRDWGSGLFDSCGGQGNDYSWSNVPCMMCDISARTGDFPCMPCIVPGALVALRARIRTLGGIQGSVKDDCIAGWCCPLCAVIQMQHELDYMGL